MGGRCGIQIQSWIQNMYAYPLPRVGYNADKFPTLKVCQNEAQSYGGNK